MYSLIYFAIAVNLILVLLMMVITYLISILTFNWLCNGVFIKVLKKTTASFGINTQLTISKVLGSTVSRLSYLSSYSLNLMFSLGKNSMNFTAMKYLFQNNPSINYWRFQVVLQLSNRLSGWSAVDIRTNHPPINGTCRADPLVGNTSTLFTVVCSKWNDTHGISQYSVYGMHLFA